MSMFSLKNYMFIFVTSLLNFILRYKMLLGIQKFSQRKGGNKVFIKMRVNSCITVIISIFKVNENIIMLTKYIFSKYFKIKFTSL